MKYKAYKRRIKDGLFGKTKNSAAGVQLKEVADARYGVMYFLARIETVATPSFGVNVVDNYFGTADLVDDAKTLSMSLLKKTQVGRRVADALNVVDEAIDKISEKIKGLLTAFIEDLFAKVKATYGHAVFAAEQIHEFSAWCVSSFVGSLADFIPGLGYLSTANDFYSAVKQSIAKGRDLIGQLYNGKGVQLLGGHPSIIANALARYSASGFMGGLKDLALTSTGLALELAGDAFAGVGSLVSILVEIFSRIIGIVDWLVQRCLLDQVLTRARNEWKVRGSSTALINNHDAFSEWFQQSVITTPIIASLVTGSGFVAHPYRFLQLLSSDKSLKSQVSFDKGVKYIETIKQLSTKHVQEFIDSYAVDFTSKDGVVAARLGELKDGVGILHGQEIAVVAAVP